MGYLMEFVQDNSSLSSTAFDTMINDVPLEDCRDGLPKILYNVHVTIPGMICLLLSRDSPNYVLAGNLLAAYKNASLPLIGQNIANLLCLLRQNIVSWDGQFGEYEF